MGKRESAVGSNGARSRQSTRREVIGVDACATERPVEGGASSDARGGDIGGECLPLVDGGGRGCDGVGGRRP